MTAESPELAPRGAAAAAAELPPGEGAADVAGAPHAAGPLAEAEVMAWGAVPLVAAVLLLGVLLLVPPLTRALVRPLEPGFEPLNPGACAPEPEEQALYLVCLLLPSVAAWGLAAASGRLAPRLPAKPVRALALVAQLGFVAATIATLVFQHVEVHEYFGVVRLGIGAIALGAFAAAWSRSRRVRDVPRWARGDSRTALLVAGVVAGAYVILRLTTAVFDDASIVRAPHSVGFHIPYALDEFAAVVNGRTPWVDFFPQYDSILPLVLAPIFDLTGIRISTFTVAMGALSFAGLLAQLDVLRRVTGNAWIALALHLPFVALAFHPVEVAEGGEANNFNYFAQAPLRYLGPWLVCALVAWHLSRPSATRSLTVFSIAGLAVLNNLDYGIPAFGAATLALLLTGPDTILPRARHAGAVLGAALGGAALAVVAFLLATWARSGEAASLAEMTLFQRAFAGAGFLSIPMPEWGLHWLVYATHMACLFTALFRLAALRCSNPAGGGEPNERLASGVLLFAGVFGAGALTIYVGRSHWAVLVANFPAWGFALVLLAWTALRRFPRTLAEWRGAPLRAVPIALAVGGCVVCAGELVSGVRPQERLAQGVAWEKVGPLLEADSLAAGIRRVASAGEKVMIVAPAGHALAERAGVVNVFPFAESGSLLLERQIDVVVATIVRERVTKIFGAMPPELTHRLRALRAPVTGFQLGPGY